MGPRRLVVPAQDVEAGDETCSSHRQSPALPPLWLRFVHGGNARRTRRWKTVLASSMLRVEGRRQGDPAESTDWPKNDVAVGPMTVTAESSETFFAALASALEDMVEAWKNDWFDLRNAVWGYDDD